MTNKKILVLNGPNLNLLGMREPEIYGKRTLRDIVEHLQEVAGDIEIEHFQSNSEEKLIGEIQDLFRIWGKYEGLIINAAAYTHTSLAIYDALKMLPKDFPIIEVHLSDPEKREEFRHFSYISLVAKKIFKGEGEESYIKALKYLIS